MNFRYKRYGSYVRPVIPVTLIHGGNIVWYEVLVDSGADGCVFDAEIGKILGLDVERGSPTIIGGIAGQMATAYQHRIDLEVGGVRRNIEVSFLPRVGEGFQYGVVGQQGFFDLFIVTFDLLAEEVILKGRER